MIDGVGKSGGAGRIDFNRSASAKAPAAVGGRTSASGKASSAGSTVADLVAAGPPVDSEKVAAIRAAIQSGNYPVDPQKIAERMLEFDLPPKG
jgi:negative regulator of flagellin synthesis FlgM